MRIQRYISLLALLFISGPVIAGFIGAGVSTNYSASFDQQENGFRVNLGSHINSVLDLEFSYVDFGASSFDDPDFINPDESDFEDNGSFENIGFGGVSSRDGGLKYSGISQIKTLGVGAGLKIRKDLNTWLEVYARASFLAWESKADTFDLYGKRNPQTQDGNIASEANAENLNPCNTLEECRQETGSIKYQALDFWYGYGLIIKPTTWLAIRTEYSIITLNAAEFPKGVLEGLSASLEIHF